MTSIIVTFFIVFGIAAAACIFGLIRSTDSELLEGECFVFGGDVGYQPETSRREYTAAAAKTVVISSADRSAVKTAA